MAKVKAKKAQGNVQTADPVAVSAAIEAFRAGNPTTVHFKTLNLSMDTFLRYAQLPEDCLAEFNTRAVDLFTAKYADILTQEGV